MENSIKERKPITMKEVFTKANAYVPLMEKAAIVSHCAERCIDRVVVDTGECFRGDVPPMYRENGQRKRRYLMGILARAYLRLDFDGRSRATPCETRRMTFWRITGTWRRC